MYQEGLYAPAPNDLVLMRFIFGLMGIIFVFLGMLFYITDIPVNGGCNWFLSQSGDPFIGQYCLFGEVRSAGAAQKAPKNKRHFSGRKKFNPFDI